MRYVVYNIKRKYLSSIKLRSERCDLWIKKRKCRVEREGSSYRLLYWYLIAIIFALYQSANRQTAEEEQPISIDTSSVVLAEARLASAKNALDGSGDFTEALCEELKEIALRYDSSSDFVSCAYPGRLYLDTPDTSNSEILTISDDTYTSKFVVDIDSSQLKGYEFTQSTSLGFNSYGGRN